MLVPRWERAMKNTIAIGLLGFVLLAKGAAAQTAVEREQILREFDRSLVEYTRQHTLAMTTVGVTAATPAPKIFTLPVAVVFRQLIAHAVASQGGPVIRGTSPLHRAAVMQPFPNNEFAPLPKLGGVLPALPAPLEYRLVDNDLVIRDATTDVVIAVLREALSTYAARH